MFTEDSIAEVMLSPLFVSDVRLVREIMAKSRVGQRELFADAAAHRLEYFVEAVLASAPDWKNGKSSLICKGAAEIAEAIAGTLESTNENSRKLRMRSALLYELASYPAIARQFSTQMIYRSLYLIGLGGRGVSAISQRKPRNAQTPANLAPTLPRWRSATILRR